MKPHLITIWIGVVLLCGCSMGGYRRLYDDSTLPKDDVASIETKGCVTILRIGSLYDLVSNPETNADAEQGGTQKLLVLPGIYDMETGVLEEAPSGVFAGRTVLSLKLQAGHHYVFSGVLGEPDPQGMFIVKSGGHFASTGISKGGNFILNEPEVVAHFSKWNLRVHERNNDDTELVNEWIDFSPVSQK